LMSLNFSKYYLIIPYRNILQLSYNDQPLNAVWESNFPPSPMPPHVLVDFVVFPPRHGRSVTDFWSWDVHETRLRCPDDVSGDIGGCSARWALKHKFYQPTQTMFTAGILPFRENSHGRTGNQTRDLMISSQRLWPLDHEAGLGM